MNSKSEKSRNMNCILIVILLYLAIYCTTSGFVNLASPKRKDRNSNDDIRIIQNNVGQPPKNMDSATWDVLNNIKKYKAIIYQIKNIYLPMILKQQNSLNIWDQVILEKTFYLQLYFLHKK